MEKCIEIEVSDTIAKIIVTTPFILSSFEHFIRTYSAAVIQVAKPNRHTVVQNLSIHHDTFRI